MGKITKIVSDFSGKEVDESMSYGVTVTNFSTKSSARLFISHDEFMELVKQHNLTPEWKPWGNN